MARKAAGASEIPSGWEVVAAAPSFAETAPVAEAAPAIPEGFETVTADAPPAPAKIMGIAPATTHDELIKGLQSLTARRAPSSTIRDYMIASNSPPEGAPGIDDTFKKYDDWLAKNQGKPYINWTKGDSPPAPEQTSAGQAAFDGAKSSLLMGGDDELDGGVGAFANWMGRNKWIGDKVAPVVSLLTGRGFDTNASFQEGSGNWTDDYERQRLASDNLKDVAYREHPLAYGTGYVMGMIPGLALPGGRLVANATTRTGRAAAMSGVGAGYGAVSGGLNDEEDRFGGAAVGAGEGALAGAVLPPLANAGGRVIKRIGEATGLNALARDGMSGLEALLTRAPQDAAALSERLAERRSLGFSDTPLVDIVDQPGAATIRTATNRNTPGRTRAVKFADQRRANIQDDTARIGENLSPVSEPVADTLGRVETARTALADDQYAQFRDVPVTVSPALRGVLDTGAGRKALAAAVETSDSPAEVAGFLSALKRGNEPSELDRLMDLLPPGMSPAAREQVQAQLMRQGIKPGEPLPTFTVDMLDRVKRGLQARQYSPDASGQSRQLGKMVDTLIAEGDRTAPGYADARGNFAGASNLIEAGEAGTTALVGGNPDEAVAASRALSDEPTPLMRMRDPEGTLSLTGAKTDEEIIDALAANHQEQYGGDPETSRNVAAGHFERNPELMRDTHGAKTQMSYSLPDGRQLKATLEQAPGSRDAVISIDGISDWSELSNSFGPGVMRDVMFSLRKQRPDIDTLNGFRVTGTHSNPAVNDAADVGIARVDIKPKIVNGPSARSIARQTARRAFENKAGQSPRSAMELADQAAVGTNFLNRTTALVGEETAGRMRAQGSAVRDRYGRAQFINPNAGSKTASMAADAGQAAINFGIDAATGGKTAIVRNVARYLNNAGIGDRNAERLVNMALDPNRVDEAIAYIGRRAGRVEARRIVNGIRAARGGGRIGGSSQDEGYKRQLSDPTIVDAPLQ